MTCYDNLCLHNIMMMMTTDNDDDVHTDLPATNLLSLKLFLSLYCCNSLLLILLRLNLPAAVRPLSTCHCIISLNLSQQPRTSHKQVCDRYKRVTTQYKTISNQHASLRMCSKASSLKRDRLHLLPATACQRTIFLSQVECGSGLSTHT